MSNLTAFNFNNIEIRTLEIDGEHYFVGKDIANVLGYSNTAEAIRDHVDIEDKLTEQIAMSGHSREMIVINESGLYSLILKSRLPQAKEFKRWVTKEVLPSIRKTGAYISPTISNNQLLGLVTAVSDLSKQMLEMKEQLNESFTETTELKQFKTEVSEHERFLELLEISKYQVREDMFTQGITVNEYLMMHNNNPFNLNDKVDPDDFATITRRTSTYYRCLTGNDPEKNSTNRNIYSGKKIAYIVATIKLVKSGI